MLELMEGGSQQQQLAHAGSLQAGGRRQRQRRRRLHLNFRVAEAARWLLQTLAGIISQVCRVPSDPECSAAQTHFEAEQRGSR